MASDLVNSESDLGTDPALIVTFGDTKQKRRPLRKRTTLLGRARGCDLGLDNRDVSAVHCLITRTSDGLVINDCDSRTGTMVNEEQVSERVLKHGDILKIGPFTFEVDIPETWKPPAEGTEEKALEDRYGRLEKKHLRAVKMAWKQRHRALETGPDEEGGSSGVSEEAAQAVLEPLSGFLEQFRLNREQAEEGLQRQIEAWQSFTETGKSLESLIQQHLGSPGEGSQAGGEVDPEALAQFQQDREDFEAEKTRIRAELEQHAQSFQETLEKQHAELQAEREAFEQERQAGEGQSDEELKKMRGELNEAELQITDLKGQLETANIDATKVPDLQQQINQLNEQVEQLQSQPGAGEGVPVSDEEMAEELKKVSIERDKFKRRFEAIREDGEKRLSALKRELDMERTRVKQLVMEAASFHDKKRAEVADLKHQVEEKESELQNMLSGGEHSENTEREVESLRNMVGDLQGQLEKKNTGPTMPVELQDFENQLIEFRDQLEQAQRALETERHDLREKLKEAELQLSKERADLARKQATLERTRDELKSELENAQREAKVMETLGPVQKLKAELRSKQEENQPAQGGGNRLMKFLKRVEDT